MATADFREQDRIRTPTTSSGMAVVAPAGGMVEAACGVAVIGLAIAGLAGAYPLALAGIAEILFGVGLLCADSGMTVYVARLRSWRGAGTAPALFAGGLGCEAIGGIAGIVLGILTLLNVAALALTAVSVLVFGATVLLGGAARARMAGRFMSPSAGAADVEAMRGAFFAALGGRTLIGLATVVLGILSVVVARTSQPGSLILALVGLLILGAGALLTGSAFSGQMMAESRR